jgi:hypothetical protein
VVRRRGTSRGAKEDPKDSREASEGEETEPACVASDAKGARKVQQRRGEGKATSTKASSTHLGSMHTVAVLPLASVVTISRPFPSSCTSNAPSSPSTNTSIPSLYIR